MKLVPSFWSRPRWWPFSLYVDLRFAQRSFRVAEKQFGAGESRSGKHWCPRWTQWPRKTTGVETDGLYGHLFGQYAIHAVVLQQVVLVRKCWCLSAGGTRCHRAVPNVLSPSPPLHYLATGLAWYFQRIIRSAAVIPFVDIDGIAAQALYLVSGYCAPGCSRWYPDDTEDAKGHAGQTKRRTEFIHS